MDDVTALRDELVLQYNATAEPSEYGAQEFNADLDALIAKVEAETRAGLVEALKPLALKYAPHSGSCCDFDAEGRIVVTRESCKCAPEERSAQEALGMVGRPEDYRAALPGSETSSGLVEERDEARRYAERFQEALVAIARELNALTEWGIQAAIDEGLADVAAGRVVPWDAALPAPGANQVLTPAPVSTPPEHPEARCQRCGRPNPVWSAPNDLWNRVMGGSDGIVCPSCFAAAAGDGLVWAFAPRPESIGFAPEPSSGDAPVEERESDEPPLGFIVWRAWFEGMESQGRHVEPRRRSWETLSEQDHDLDAAIETRVATWVLDRHRRLFPCAPRSAGAGDGRTDR